MPGMFLKANHITLRRMMCLLLIPGKFTHLKSIPGKLLEIINCLFMSSCDSDSLLKELGVSESMDFFYIHPFLNKKERFHHLLNLGGIYSSRFLSLLEGMMYECDKEKPCSPTFIRLQLVELLILLSRIYNEMKSSISGLTPRRMKAIY